MPQLPTLIEMLKAGLHFGHQRSRWHPKMKPYLFGVRNGVHIIDLDQTLGALERGLKFLADLSAAGQVVLLVGTKRQARDIIKAAAEACGMPYLTERWIGGLLTNFDEFKRRLKKYHTLRDLVGSGEIEKYTKKEQLTFKKQLATMDKYLAGLSTLEKLPDALYLCDGRVEKTALTEARRMKVPVVAVTDSNVDPTKVTYAIPGNDDAVQAIKLVATLVSQAVQEGRAEAARRAAAVPVAESAPVAAVSAAPHAFTKEVVS